MPQSTALLVGRAGWRKAWVVPGSGDTASRSSRTLESRFWMAVEPACLLFPGPLKGLPGVRHPGQVLWVGVGQGSLSTGSSLCCGIYMKKLQVIPPKESKTFEDDPQKSQRPEGGSPVGWSGAVERKAEDK